MAVNQQVQSLIKRKFWDYSNATRWLNDHCKFANSINICHSRSKISQVLNKLSENGQHRVTVGENVLI